MKRYPKHVKAFCKQHLLRFQVGLDTLGGVCYRTGMLKVVWDMEGKMLCEALSHPYVSRLT